MAKIFGPDALAENVLNKGLCIGCGACVNLCPYLKTHRGKTAMIFPCTLVSGRCFAYCPKVEVDLDELAAEFWDTPYDGNPVGPCVEVWMARAGEKMTAGAFQAGGTVSALMSFSLKTGMIDAAVLTDREGLIPVPRLVTQSEAVAGCASSKFTAAPTLAALNQGIEQGYHRIGVVGTPCQVLAMAKMRSNPMKEDPYQDTVALVVGLFCTWALDARKLTGLLSDRVQVADIQAMDMPPPPDDVMIIQTGNGIVKIPLDEVRPLVPRGCRICPDMTAEWADVSVGVVEGKPDWNTLIVRNDKGRCLVEAAHREGWLVLEKLPDQNFNHLCAAAATKKKRALVQAKKKDLLNRPGKDEVSALRLREEVVEKIIS